MYHQIAPMVEEYGVSRVLHIDIDGALRFAQDFTQRRPSTAPPLGRLGSFAYASFTDLDEFNLHPPPSSYIGSDSDTPFSWSVPMFSPEVHLADPTFDDPLERLRLAANELPCPTSSASRKRQARISRPPNAWIIYRSEKLAEMKSVYSKTKTPQAELSKMIAERWRAETPQSKKRYEMMASQRKAEHGEKYPDYKFKPRRKGDKGGSPPAATSPKPAIKRPRLRRHANLNQEAPSEVSLLSIESVYSDTPFSMSFAEDQTMMNVGTPSDSSSQLAMTPSTSYDGLPPLSNDQINLLAPIPKRFSFDSWLCSTTGEVPNLTEHQPSSSKVRGDDIPLARQNFAVDHLPIPPLSSLTPISPSDVFQPPASDYAFPPRSGIGYPESLNSYMPWSQDTSAATTPTFEESLPAWWAFRNVKVKRDEEGGVPLETFLQSLAEEAGQETARRAMGSQ